MIELDPRRDCMRKMTIAVAAALAFGAATPWHLGAVMAAEAEATFGGGGGGHFGGGGRFASGFGGGHFGAALAACTGSAAAKAAATSLRPIATIGSATEIVLVAPPSSDLFASE
jgi:hypothetical protein